MKNNKYSIYKGKEQIKTGLTRYDALVIANELEKNLGFAEWGTPEFIKTGGRK